VKRITKIEMYKNFRQPITIFGCIILALLMVVLVFFYSPTDVSQEERYSIEGNNITSIYSDYNSVILPNIENNIKASEKIIKYYSDLEIRNSNIEKYKKETISNYELLGNAIASGENANAQCTQLYNSLVKFQNEIINFNNLEDITYISYVINDGTYLSNPNFINLDKIVQQINDTSSNPSWGVNTYQLLDKNNYVEKLNACAYDAKNFVNYVLNSYNASLKSNYDNYINKIENTPASLFKRDVADSFKNNFVSNYNNFKNIFDNLFSYDFDIILCKEKVLDDLKESFKNLDTILESPTRTRAEHLKLVKHLKSMSFINEMDNFVDNFTTISINEGVVKELNSYLSSVQQKTKTLDNKIAEYYSVNNINEMKTAIKQQISLHELFNNLINNDVRVACYNDYNSYKKYLDDNMIYSSQSEISFAKYCIDNDNYPLDIKNISQFNYQVNSSVDCYDYMTFAIKIASSVIIIICLYLSCASIAGEHKNGTLRFILTSPNTRNQIFNGKLRSVTFTGIILLMTSFIVAFVTSLVKFGIPADYNIVTVFNATTVLTFNPILAVIIYLLCQMIVIISITTIMFLFSTSIKSFVGSLISCFGFLGISFIFAKIKSPVISILPTNNFDLSKYFYMYEYGSTDNILHFIFDSTRYSIQDFYLSAIITIFTVIIVKVISKYIFRKQSY